MRRVVAGHIGAEDVELARICHAQGSALAADSRNQLDSRRQAVLQAFDPQGAGQALLHQLLEAFASGAFGHHAEDGGVGSVEIGRSRMLDQRQTGEAGDEIGGIRRHRHVLFRERRIEAGNAGGGVVETGLVVEQVAQRHRRVGGFEGKRAG